VTESFRVKKANKNHEYRHSLTIIQIVLFPNKGFLLEIFFSTVLFVLGTSEQQPGSPNEMRRNMVKSFFNTPNSNSCQSERNSISYPAECNRKYCAFNMFNVAQIVIAYFTVDLYFNVPDNHDKLSCVFLPKQFQNTMP